MFICDRKGQNKIQKKNAGIAHILWKIVYKHWGVLVKGMERSLKIWLRVRKNISVSHSNSS